MATVKKQLNNANKLYLNSKVFQNTNKINDMKVFRAKARRTIKISKRRSWRSHVSKINHKTPILRKTIEGY